MHPIGPRHHQMLSTEVVFAEMILFQTATPHPYLQSHLFRGLYCLMLFWENPGGFYMNTLMLYSHKLATSHSLSLNSLNQWPRPGEGPDSVPFSCVSSGAREEQCLP